MFKRRQSEVYGVLARPTRPALSVAATVRLLLIATALSPAAALAQPAPAQPAAAPAAPPAAAAPAPTPQAAPPPAAAPPVGTPPAPAPTPPSAAPQSPEGTWIPTPDGKSYTWVPAGYQPPPVLPYREGRPIPPGYKLEERPRRGAVITGFVLSGVGYGIGLTVAYSSEFANKSGYMLVPWAGPWLTMGLRDWHDCNSRDEDGTNDGALSCGADALVFIGLLFDGMIQAAGGITLAIGYAAKKEVLIYQNAAFYVTPSRIADGYGLSAIGNF